MIKSESDQKLRTTEQSLYSEIEQLKQKYESEIGRLNSELKERE